MLRGCVPMPSEIDLRAEPIRVSRLDSEGAVDPRATDLIARIARTAEPRTLRFTIHGVQPSKPYHLTIAQLPTGNCDRIFWRGPFAGLVVSGGPRVLIEGFAATTQVEVLDQATDEWIGTDRFSPDDSSALRWFRWRSSLQNIVGGELQVSTLRFPNEGNFGACDEPLEGIVHRQYVPARDGA